MFEFQNYCSKNLGKFVYGNRKFNEQSLKQENRETISNGYKKWNQCLVFVQSKKHYKWGIFFRIFKV